jgi:hypothetical protein
MGILVDCGADEIGVVCAMIDVVYCCKADKCVTIVLIFFLIWPHVWNDIAVCAVELCEFVLNSYMNRILKGVINVNGVCVLWNWISKLVLA